MRLRLLVASLVVLTLSLLLLVPPALAADAGVYIEGGQTRVTDYERWLGRDVKYQLAFAGHRQSWAQVRHSTAAILRGPVRTSGNTVVLSLPFAVEGEAPTPCEALRGNAFADPDVYDYYGWLGHELRRLGYDQPFPDGRPRAVIRPAWEQTGPWFPWQGVDCPDTYRALWHLAHYRVGIRSIPWEFSVMTDADWDGRLRALIPNPSTFDIFSMSYYDNGVDPERRAGGLPMLSALAAEYGKPMSLSEVGKASWAMPIDRQLAWFRHLAGWVQANEHRLVYVNYFEHGPWAVRSQPRLASTFRELFGA